MPNKIGGVPSGPKPGIAGSAKTASVASEKTIAKPAEAPVKAPETPAKPLTEGAKGQRKQDKQLSGVMKKAAFQSAIKEQESFALGSSKSKVSSQAKYGPTADLSAKDQQALKKHYGDGGKGKNPLDRQTQYDKKHSTYVSAAKDTGRGLTEQEAKAAASGKNTKGASINHVIASGTGQSVMNESTLQFGKGRKMVEDKYKTAVSDPKGTPQEAIDAAQKDVRSGIAKQAAAAGRMQGYSREIIKERKGETGVDVTEKRNEALQDTLTAFQGKSKSERFGAYKKVLKDTFDSPGNLRVGNGSANTKVSTGFDAELKADGKISERSARLLHTHKTFAPDRLLTDERLFTKDADGKIMSSSKQVKPKDED